ALEVLP
ncbi:hormone-sensitive lipase, partial [Danaus plexippus plexippus]